MNNYDIIIKPKLSEKTYADIANKKYCFVVATLNGAQNRIYIERTNIHKKFEILRPMAKNQVAYPSLWGKYYVTLLYIYLLSSQIYGCI